MKIVGKINLSKFETISCDIKTNEVIITDKQIAHIKENHPGDYESYNKYIPQILDKPDYILNANMPFSAVLLKAFLENDKKFQLVLRLKTSNDPEEYINSVITFFKISTKRYNRYINSGKIIYKSE